jgi:hypothetical protein
LSFESIFGRRGNKKGLLGALSVMIGLVLVLVEGLEDVASKI